jgi:hypothetical protein
LPSAPPGAKHCGSLGINEGAPGLHGIRARQGRLIAKQEPAFWAAAAAVNFAIRLEVDRRGLAAMLALAVTAATQGIDYRVVSEAQAAGFRRNPNKIPCTSWCEKYPTDSQWKSACYRACNSPGHPQCVKDESRNRPEAGSCSAGKITCEQWCARHPERTRCMTGDPNSCDKKPFGPKTCVRAN